MRWKGFQLDAGYAHIFAASRVVSHSTITAREFSSQDATGPAVGNGVYQSSVDMLSLQLTCSFGRGSDPQIRFARHPAVSAPRYAANEAPTAEGDRLARGPNSPPHLHPDAAMGFGPDEDLPFGDEMADERDGFASRSEDWPPPQESVPQFDVDVIRLEEQPPPATIKFRPENISLE